VVRVGVRVGEAVVVEAVVVEAVVVEAVVVEVPPALGVNPPSAIASEKPPMIRARETTPIIKPFRNWPVVAFMAYSAAGTSASTG
jgi:hypothetical protein